MRNMVCNMMAQALLKVGRGLYRTFGPIQKVQEIKYPKEEIFQPST
jgi:hypothetical protein